MTQKKTKCFLQINIAQKLLKISISCKYCFVWDLFPLPGSKFHKDITEIVESVNNYVKGIESILAQVARK